MRIETSLADNAAMEMGPIEPGFYREGSGGGELSRRAEAARILWLLPLVLAGMAVAAARAPVLGEWLERLFGTAGRGQPGRIRRALQGTSLSALRRSILGNTKEAVASVFGPPRTSALQVRGREQGAQLGGETWYYLLDRQDRSAMAIRFARDRAAQVEFIRSPAG